MMWLPKSVRQEKRNPMLDSLDTLVAPVVLEEPAARLAREVERRRIARELHDGVVQTLTALVTDLEYFRTHCLPMQEDMNGKLNKKVETWQCLAREGLDSMRQALGCLRGADRASSTLDLPRAIEELLATMQSRGYHIEFECEDWGVMLPGEYAENLFSIVREALVNISKHAHASLISVTLLYFESCLFLSIADDGVGMRQNEPGARYESGYHQGLFGMRERVALLDGRMAIESVPLRGTRINIEIPWES